VYNACYLTYLEVAQVEYFRSLGILTLPRKGGEQRASFDTATVKATLEFKASARLVEMIDVYTRVLRIGSSSFTMETEIYREDSDVLLVNAEVVYVNYDSDQSVACPVSDDVRARINKFEENGEVIPTGEESANPR
jgi:acyl-CoA thioester hydrolase